MRRRTTQIAVILLAGLFVIDSIPVLAGPFDGKPVNVESDAQRPASDNVSSGDSHRADPVPTWCEPPFATFELLVAYLVANHVNSGGRWSGAWAHLDSVLLEHAHLAKTPEDAMMLWTLAYQSATKASLGNLAGRLREAQSTGVATNKTEKASSVSPPPFKTFGELAAWRARQPDFDNNSQQFRVIDPMVLAHIPLVKKFEDFSILRNMCVSNTAVNAIAWQALEMARTPNEVIRAAKMSAGNATDLNPWARIIVYGATKFTDTTSLVTLARMLDSNGQPRAAEDLLRTAAGYAKTKQDAELVLKNTPFLKRSGMKKALPASLR